MTATHDAPRIHWRLAEQRMSGTPDEVAAELDELILKLAAYRHSLDGASHNAEARRPATWRNWFAFAGRAAAAAPDDVERARTKDAAAEVEPQMPWTALAGGRWLGD